MKTYVLTVSKVFLKGHPKAGHPTHFKEQISTGDKKHTIRQNYDYWSEVIDQVKAGQAILSVREWTGKPYRSKQEEFLRLDKDSGIGYQEIFMTHSGWCWEASIEGEYVVQLDTVCKNDGLSKSDFESWFFPDYNKNDVVSGIIIHFTKFRY